MKTTWMIPLRDHGHSKRSGRYSSCARSEKRVTRRVERQLNGAGRSVTLLADDHLGLAVTRSISACHLKNSSVPSFGMRDCM